jgi:hypothetical protein
MVFVNEPHRYVGRGKVISAFPAFSSYSEDPSYYVFCHNMPEDNAKPFNNILIIEEESLSFFPENNEDCFTYVLRTMDEYI